MNWLVGARRAGKRRRGLRPTAYWLTTTHDRRRTGTDSVLVCLITPNERDAPLLRVALPAGEQTGLHRLSWVQLEKLTAVARNQVGQRIGVADGVAMLDVGRKLTVLLGIG